MRKWEDSATRCYTVVDQFSQSNVYRVQVRNEPGKRRLAEIAIELHTGVCAFLPPHDCSSVVHEDIGIIEEIEQKAAGAESKKEPTV